jgi:hypothetical protein
MILLTLTNREYADLQASVDGQIARLVKVTVRKSKQLGRLRRLRSQKINRKVVHAPKAHHVR